MAWSTYLSGQHLARQLRREHLLPGLAWASLCLLIGGGLWLNIELLWSLHPQDHAPPAAQPGDPQASADAISHRHMFGLPSSAPSQQAAPIEFRLLGILAGQHPELGAAIFLANGGKRPLIAHVGENLAPGIKLTGLNARQATLSRDAVSFTLELANTNATPSPPQKPVSD